MTVKDLMEILKELNPDTEVHCFDNSFGWSDVSITVTKEEGVIIESK